MNKDQKYIATEGLLAKIDLVKISREVKEKVDKELEKIQNIENKK